jgi:hypothetical protein
MPIPDSPVSPFRQPRQQTRTLASRFSALVGGELAVAYRADALALLGLVTWSPRIGYTVTGLILGRGANYLHDLVERWLATLSSLQRGQ